MGVYIESAGFSVDGTEVKLYHMNGDTGLELVVTNLGAAAVSILLGNEKEKTDVLLGFEELSRQLEKGPMFGVTLGRYAGKIMGASYEWEGQEYLLSKSHGENHGHGGIRGFDKHIFKTVSADRDQVVFEYISPDGEEGYPGTLVLHVTYRIDGKNIKILYSASTDKDTPVGISNHMYFNLLGNSSEEVVGHEVSIRAAEAAGIDEKGLPSGEIFSVKHTTMDLRSPKQIADCLNTPTEMIKKIGRFDHDYILDKNMEKPAAVLFEPCTGRKLELYTDMPCIHFYVPDFNGMKYTGKNKAIYDGKCGVAFEPMFVGDCLHNGIGPSPILRAGERRVNETRLLFTW